MSPRAKLRPDPGPFRALSWGCGVQSTTLAVMSALGDLEPADAVMTADTGWERRLTYQVRDFYTQWLRERGLDVHIVSAGNVRELGAIEHAHIPFWTETGGPLKRQCTREFKIRPIRRLTRELLGYPPSSAPHPRAQLRHQPGAVEQWMGISLDEYTRMKKSDVKFIVNRYPLVENRISRQECVRYLEGKGLPVPVKSACIGCPYCLASEWLEMRDQDPEEFAEAVAFDEANRHNPLAVRAGSTADKLYIFKAKRTKPIPLAEADLEDSASREKSSKQLPLFCDSGFCHV